MILDTVQTLQTLVPTGSDAVALSHWIQHSVELFPLDWNLLAQQFDTDVFAGPRTFFQNFIETGQVWALIIGVVIGYMMRSLTSYG
ncbi:MAG: hypothetical protein WBA57_09675 [Elainellaceae cyanobacterium]